MYAFFIHTFLLFVCVCVWKEENDQQWKQAMDYLSAVTELNYMTQIVIMLYEDNNKVGLLTAVTSTEWSQYSILEHL